MSKKSMYKIYTKVQVKFISVNFLFLCRQKKRLLKLYYFITVLHSLHTNLVEMRLNTALKLLQLRENKTPEAEFRSSAACWFPSRQV